MHIREVRGLKYPDIFVTRFFFASSFHRTGGHVLELGCGNGNNLMLYDAYGWEVTGIDISQSALNDARHNFSGRGNWIQHDLALGIPELPDSSIDVLLVPNVLNYLSRRAARSVLCALASKMAPDSNLFVSVRSTGDYRFGRGEMVEHNGFVLNTPETGEAGLLNVFYSEHEVVTLLQEALGIAPGKLNILHSEFDNIQNERLVPHNSDLIFWA